ncbi:hypothetical protein A5724_19100 [Mycobacterium sp. ACS1612]|uniref:pyridoxamine 5'-phosphate oxidase family protein n=1 Tax=Mycobacterium sp. ACS1612 TaxID=1834117 RepID=UPI000801AB10|nr:pyridoxamine 5'-phosphate oxidase family protein [Mycobacterium sp. ACS1612]OBF33661.1 hypothetical protein A5724_19100 [Mycobacterium sp. ACS1612]
MPRTYHAGELAVQAQADTVAQAAKMAHTVRTNVPAALSMFLSALPWVLIGGIDALEHVWASPIFGKPGFVGTPTDAEVRIAAHILMGDPLHGAGARGTGWPAGMLAIDLRWRMRARINGTIRADEGGMTITVDECYANCPKYIQDHQLDVEDVSAQPTRVRSDRMSAKGRALVRGADTMFIASVGPDLSADVSHRGGPSGFVECSADGTALRFADYPGNGVFNTLGNLHCDARSGLTFFGFETGELLQLTGYASSKPTRNRTVEFNVVEAIWCANLTRRRP